MALVTAFVPLKNIQLGTSASEQNQNDYLDLRVGRDTFATNRKTIGFKGELMHGIGIDFGGDVRVSCKQGRVKEAVRILDIMDEPGVRPDSSIYDSLLRECSDKNAMPEGKMVHAHMIHTACNQDIILGTKLLAMYAKCGSLVDARRVLDGMPERNVVSWTAMISAYSRHGHDEEALVLFFQMQRAGIQPNQYTFSCVLSACGNLGALEQGKVVHKNIIRRGFEAYIFVGSALVDMYAKCGSVEDACQVFDKMPERNVVTWNAIVAAYAQNGRVHEALQFFQEMPERNTVSWNTMVSGYAQMGYVPEALKLFQKMPERCKFSWNTMITGYAQNEHSDEALKLFRQMQQRGVKPDAITFMSVLPACAILAALKNGKEIYGNVIRSGFHSDIFVGSALVDMYAKCGTIEDASKVFDKMPERNVVSWTAMIMGYAMHGYGREALNLFQQMQHSGTKPNHVTFIGILSACCHAGLVDDGWQYFDCMCQDYHITPSVEHYCCMVDLLGRAGLLEEARDLINKMPVKPNAAVWGSLLGASRIHTNIEIGEYVAERLFELEPENSGCYVLLSNIYAAAGRWDEAKNVRKLMRDRRVKKSPGCSWIEVNGKVYCFLVGDTSHPQMHEIYAELERLSGKMKEAGYVPDVNLVLHDVEEEEEEHILCHNRENLETPAQTVRELSNV